MNRTIAFTAACLAGLAMPAWADPQGLSTFVPVQIQDALLVSPGTLEFQEYNLYTRNTHGSSGPDLLQIDPTIKIGPTNHVQIDISAPYEVGNASGASQGNGSIDGFYAFTDPTPTFPALAVQLGDQALNYGPGHKTDNYFARGLLTQWLGSDDKAPRLHLNIDYTHYTEPADTGRRDQIEYGAAYSQLVTPQAALVLDIVHGETTTKKQDETIFDVGMRYEINEQWALSGSAGAGIEQQSPQFRVLFAIQRDFHLF